MCVCVCVCVGGGGGSVCVCGRGGRGVWMCVCVGGGGGGAAVSKSYFADIKLRVGSLGRALEETTNTVGKLSSPRVVLTFKTILYDVNFKPLRTRHLLSSILAKNGPSTRYSALVYMRYCDRMLSRCKKCMSKMILLRSSQGY